MSQNNAITVYCEYSYSGIVSKERALSQSWIHLRIYEATLMLFRSW